ncbi:unnamed protein product [Allacma fusca]|uniref:Regulatory protein zeste n=1 Tax=Allacma fusca TaxID=39272 RepID=A0A8J2JHW7_9HEXA|nr:unnamed protein product [Allacma fusca]
MEPSKADCISTVAATTKIKRSDNWSISETETLVQEVVNNYDVLFGKFSSTLDNKSKDILWAAITTSVNTRSLSHRTTEQIKLKWRDLKSKAKKDAAKIVKEKGTGGEVDDVDMEEFQKMIVGYDEWFKKVVKVIGISTIVGMKAGRSANNPQKRKHEDEDCPSKSRNDLTVLQETLEETRLIRTEINRHNGLMERLTVAAEGLLEHMRLFSN